MRVASFNIRSGLGDDGCADPDRLAGELSGLDADVLALQEVDRAQERSGRVDQAALAAGAAGVEGPRHLRFEPALWGTPGTASATGVPGAVGDPTYGVALVSRLPVRAWRRIELPHTPLALPVPLEGFRLGRRTPVSWLADEPRVAIAAVLEPPARLATVVTTHLSFVPGVNAVQLRRVAAAVRGLPRPLLLLGDLNLPAGVAWILRGARDPWCALDSPATFPSHDPRMRLDRALLSGTPGGRVTTRAVRAGVSDHRALVVELGV